MAKSYAVCPKCHHGPCKEPIPADRTNCRHLWGDTPPPRVEESSPEAQRTFLGLFRTRRT